MSFSHFKWYFRKKVTALRLNTLQDNIAGAIERPMKIRNTYGLFSTPLVTGVGPDFTYQIDSQDVDPLQGFDKLGRYAAIDENPHLVNITSLFTPPGAGQEKWLTLVLRYAIEEAQPEVEKLTFTTVNFLQNLSFEIGVLEGADAGPGLAVKPSLAAEDGIYIADILVEDGDTDATATTIQVSDGRLRLDPVREVTDRGLDGVVERLALISDVEAGPGSRPGVALPIGFDGTIGDTSPIPLPAGTKFVHLHIVMGGGGSFLSAGSYVLDVDANRLDGGWQTDSIGTGLVIGSNPNVAGTAICSVPSAGPGGVVSLATKTFVGGILQLQKIGVASGTTSGQITAIFFR